jgi:myo-inositol-1(or 4)-monophosphatase
MNNPFPDSALQIYLDAAIEMALKGGECLLKGWGQVKEISFKGAIDLVTETDFESQQVILGIIREKFPHHSILAEEEGGIVAGASEALWIVDPLDGTTNFAHGFPFVCVSIALALSNELTVGVVYNPVMNELFFASKGKGAFLNHRPIGVSQQTSLKQSLLGTGFSYNLAPIKKEVINRFSAFLSASQGIRRPGSAALDLCYVGSGVFDGFWEQDLQPWDVAAGTVIVREAGGSVTDFSGASLDVNKKEILASNGLIHQQMLDLLKA